MTRKMKHSQEAQISGAVYRGLSQRQYAGEFAKAKMQTYISKPRYVTCFFNRAIHANEQGLIFNRILNALEDSGLAHVELDYRFSEYMGRSAIALTW